MATKKNGLTPEMLQGMLEKLEQRLIEKMEGIREEIKQDVEKRNDQIREDIIAAVSCLAGGMKDLQEQVEEISKENVVLGEKVEMVENKLEQGEVDMIRSQYREMEFAVRVRGLREQKEENLREIFTDALAELVQENKEIFFWRMDKIFRVNSWVARQRSLPRDIVIYFTTRMMRNLVLQCTFNSKIIIKGQEVVFFKETPPKMLRARKDYYFLIDELKKKGIQYRWEVPVGLSLNYQGRRYRLTSVEKARDFYVNVFKAGASEKIVGGKVREEEQAQGGTQLRLEDDQSKDQRQTRAATRRKEQLLQQHLEMESQQTLRTEAVGGARPKEKSYDQAQRLLQMLQDARSDK